MKWNEFFRAMEAGQYAPVYLFTGPEEAVKREALEALRGKLLPAGLEAMNEVTLEDVGARQIIDAAQTLPMLCERRVVVVRDWAPLLPGKSKNEESETALMQAWLENPPPSCVLVFYMRSEPDRRKKLPALLLKKAEVVQFELLNDQELSRWCARRLKPSGKRISPQALGALTYMAGRELTRLDGELDKLCDYLGDERDEIEPRDVYAVVSPSLEYNVFELLSCLLAGDMAKGQQTLNSLLQNGQSPVGLMAMLTRQVRQLAHMKCALDAGGSVQQVQSQLKLHPYAAKQTARQCAKLSARWLIELYQSCVETDYDVKRGRLRDRDALEALALRIGLAKDRN